MRLSYNIRVKSKPYLTVVVPALNEEELLPKLFLSLSQQSFRDFEVILVDGKSEDKTVEMAKKFAKKLPRLSVYVSDYRNVSYQRNLGASKAKGSYLVFFDADVQLAPDFLITIAAYLKKNKSGLLTTWIKTENHSFSDWIITIIANIGSEISKIIGRPYAGGYNIVVKKRVFDKISGFNPAIFHGEDHDFTIRCNDEGVKLEILQNQRIIYSTRRYDKFGLFAVLKKDTTSLIHVLQRRPLTRPAFDYPMGGGCYK